MLFIVIVSIYDPLLKHLMGGGSYVADSRDVSVVGIFGIFGLVSVYRLIKLPFDLALLSSLYSD